MPEYLYLDIETVGTSDPRIIAEIEASVTPPGNYKKAESIAEWEANSKPALVKEAVEKTAFSGAVGRVVCTGWAWNDDPAVALTATDEGDLLSAFVQGATDTKPVNFYQPVIVGHNVATFDVRFLWQRAYVLGIRLPAWFPRDARPWADNINDTMAMWSGARESISLDNLCRALSLPGKGNITGADVGKLWAEGAYETIAEYCRGDVERVRNVHRRMLLAMGEVPAKQTAA